MILDVEHLDTERHSSGATCNACKLCTPLGACMAFVGIENCIPILHGSQGCSTYIRRYMISHFREPVDIASSSFTEEDTVYGGGRNLAMGVNNLMKQYHPGIIGIATTCLSETIGEDVPAMVREIGRAVADEEGVKLIHVSTPSYTGTHSDGFNDTCLAIVKALAKGEKFDSEKKRLNLFPGMLSPADFRYYRELVEDMGMRCVMIPDYSDRLDGPTWADYHRIPTGGTPRHDIEISGSADASIECGALLPHTKETAGRYLSSAFGVKHIPCGLPIGIRETDRFINALEVVAGVKLPQRHAAERGRLVDSMIDAHKYLFGKRVAIYGDPDLVIGLTSLVSELGMTPVICATGGRPAGFTAELERVLIENAGERPEILGGADHVKLHERCEALKPDLILGSSKGYTISRKLGIPLVRVGFPVHDRMGGQRLLHIGYRGAQVLFDRIVNTILEHKQASNEVGYTYL